MPPMISAASPMDGAARKVAARRSAQLAASASERMPASRAWTIENPMNSTTSARPGPTPARNSASTDSSVMKA